MQERKKAEEAAAAAAAATAAAAKLAAEKAAAEKAAADARSVGRVEADGVTLGFCDASCFCGAPPRVWRPSGDAWLHAWRFRKAPRMSRPSGDASLGGSRTSRDAPRAHRDTSYRACSEKNGAGPSFLPKSGAFRVRFSPSLVVVALRPSA